MGGRLRWLPCVLLFAGAGCADSRGPCAGSAAPQSIAEMVDHLNGLPGPIDAACLLDSLERPLRLEATSNEFSAQPAGGIGSPRIFVFSGDLSISIVPSGPGAGVIEFGETIDSMHSLKGELVMPVDGFVEAQDAHERIVEADQGSVCRICHVEEEEIVLPGGIGHASIGIRPDDDSRVDLGVLRDVSKSCDTSLYPERCAVLEALFAGSIEPQQFPERFPTLLDLVPNQ